MTYFIGIRTCLISLHLDLDNASTLHGKVVVREKSAINITCIFDSVGLFPFVSKSPPD